MTINSSEHSEDNNAPDLPATADITPVAESPVQGEPGADSEPETSVPDSVATVLEAEVQVHRSPRYARFMLAGGIIFAIAAFIVTYSTPQDGTYSQSTVLGFTLAIFVTVGVTVGAVIALVVDRIVSRRLHTVQADRINVRVSDGETQDSPSDTER